jgi:splicing factor U2AF subunit
VELLKRRESALRGDGAAPMSGMPVPASGVQMPAAAAAAVAAALGGNAPGKLPISHQLVSRHARRIYVGGLPPTCTEELIKNFFSGALVAIRGTAGEGEPIINTYHNREKSFAFLEFRSVAEASNAMALDGILYEGVALRVRRPNDYNPTAAASLGPGEPAPELDLAALGLSRQKVQTGQNMNDPDRVFLGGLPYYLTEEQIVSLVEPFGTVATIDLIKDPATGLSKGYCFIIFKDPSVVDAVCAGLSGMQVAERSLTVQRAIAGEKQREERKQMKSIGMLPQGVPNVAMPGQTAGFDPMPYGQPSCVLQLKNAVTDAELDDDEEHADLTEDMQQECAQYGQLVKLAIPRQGAGRGLVLLEYADVGGASAAQRALHGRKCSGQEVEAKFLQPDEYATLQGS